MKIRYGVVHMLMSRRITDPERIHWYVRRVWMDGRGTTHDRVVADGAVLSERGRPTEVIIAEVLREALALIESRQDTSMAPEDD